MRSLRAAASTLSPSRMSMARLAFPSRLELNRPEGSFSTAPLGKVILTTFLYVSPVQTMPPWEKTGVPLHFHSSTISGSAPCMISRTFASVFPRQSPSSLILSSINAEADSTGAGLFMSGSNSRTYAGSGKVWGARRGHPPASAVSLAGKVGHEHLRGLVGDHELHAGPLRDRLGCHTAGPEDRHLVRVDRSRLAVIGPA